MTYETTQPFAGTVLPAIFGSATGGASAWLTSGVSAAAPTVAGARHTGASAGAAAVKIDMNVQGNRPRGPEPV